MSDNSKEIGFYESIREEAIQKNDASKLAMAESKLEELRSGKTPDELDLPEVSRTPFEFIQKINFDEYAKLPGNTLNSIVQTLLNIKAATVQEEAITQCELRIAALNSGFEEERTNWQYQNNKLQADLQTMGESNLLITEEKNRYKLMSEDFESRFKALELKYNDDIADKDVEIKRMKAHEADLHDQIARAPAPTARPIIDITAGSTDLDELIRQAKEQRDIETQRKEEERKAALIKVTNIRWEDPTNRTFYNAELVLDGVDGKAGDTTRFHYFKKGQYLEVTAEDAGRFRAEAAATSENTVVESVTLVEPVLEVPEIGEVNSFREEEAVLPVCEPSDIGGVAPEAYVTRQEFEALKEEVNKRFESIIGDVA